MHTRMHTHTCTHACTHAHQQQHNHGQSRLSPCGLASVRAGPCTAASGARWISAKILTCSPPLLAVLTTADAAGVLLIQAKALDCCLQAWGRVQGPSAKSLEAWREHCCPLGGAVPQQMPQAALPQAVPEPERTPADPPTEQRPTLLPPRAGEVCYLGHCSPP